jgi:hypothetical protein
MSTSTSNKGLYDEDKDEITITLMNAACGSTESLCISASNTTLLEIVDFSRAFFGHNLDVAIQLFRDGKRINDKPSSTVKAAGIKHGDVLAVVTAATKSASTSGRVAASSSSSSSATLDFSNLLAQHPTVQPGSSTNKNAIAASSVQQQHRYNLMNANNMRVQTEPVQWEKISLDDAIQYNPNPDCFVTLLFSSETHPNLFKELNHRSPALAKKLRDAYESHGGGVSAAANVWREELVKGSIQRAFDQVKEQSKQIEMQLKLVANPSDSEALGYFANQQHQQLIDSQYQMVMDQYPESMGRVLMLYIDAMINNVPIKAFVDSGAQMTIISKNSLSKVGLDHLIDTRFSGVAVGVGTGKILGRVHVAPLLIQHRFFPVTLTVLESANSNNTDHSTTPQQQLDGGVDFIFGLDMLKRHRCKIDLGRNILVIPLDDGQNLEVPFLHEKDLDVSKGGTKGFNADASNDELMQRILREEDNDDDTKMKKRKEDT